jgi:acyl-homoserine-lactone acylase
VLQAWDRRTDSGSRGAVLFLLWVLQTGAAGLRAEALFARDWTSHDPLRTPSGLADPGEAVAALGRAAAMTTAAFGSLDVPWGQAFRLRHGNGDHPGHGGPGDPLGIFQFIAYAPTPAGWTSVAGDTATFAVEFTQPPTARAVTVYGNWSRPGSRHVSDQLELYAERRTRPVLRDLADIEAHLQERQHLTGPE